MIETVFYLQMAAFFIFLILGIIYRSWPLFVLAGVFSILTGAMLASGEPVEFFTGEFTVTENTDGNVWATIADVNALTPSNSSVVNMWHYILLYGGFVWIIVALVLAITGRTGVPVVEDER